MTRPVTTPPLRPPCGLAEAAEASDGRVADFTPLHRSPLALRVAAAGAEDRAGAAAVERAADRVLLAALGAVELENTGRPA
ncbi:MAG: hypothetical protein AVDCRST_MAG53-1974 [uncultured Solirubrobacteraceae bacterium]|uniref:Uncharacterized protein n=1 Tax=uncultured Solirubrobacteraceae bacterium TaxID=1162706 RepID=A0A6J4SPW4_9ACTN|nr:MAG: hypothetical protein AVDCRST_MAG53-1974 [uncultured Solirubrobacteraceae bacterium]